jgi:hypothetical protein
MGVRCWPPPVAWPGETSRGSRCQASRVPGFSGPRRPKSSMPPSDLTKGEPTPEGVLISDRRTLARHLSGATSRPLHFEDVFGIDAGAHGSTSRREAVQRPRTIPSSLTDARSASRFTLRGSARRRPRSLRAAVRRAGPAKAEAQRLEPTSLQTMTSMRMKPWRSICAQRHA